MQQGLRRCLAVVPLCHAALVGGEAPTNATYVLNAHCKDSTASVEVGGQGGMQGAAPLAARAPPTRTPRGKTVAFGQI